METPSQLGKRFNNLNGCRTRIVWILVTDTAYFAMFATDKRSIKAEPLLTQSRTACRIIFPLCSGVCNFAENGY